MDRLRLAIVGCRTIAPFNASGYLNHDLCDTTALYDPIAERAIRRATEWNIQPTIYESYQDVLADAEVDAVELLPPLIFIPAK